MGDPNGGLNGSAIKINKEFMAWIFRAALTVITAAGLYILSDFKDVVKTQGAKMDLLGTAQATLSTSLNVLAQSVNDNIRQENDVITSIRNSQQDHETRIRTLERPAPGNGHQ